MLPIRAGFLLMALTIPASGVGEEVHVAVAANFAEAAEELAASFTRDTGVDVVLSTGSTGQLFAQITEGAPYDVFLAADAATPARAVEDGIAVEGTAFTYAIGQLVLFSPDSDLVTGAETLTAAAFHHLAIADPETAPYGAAAAAVIEKLGLSKTLRPKVVTGTSISQTYQFVESGSAELGFLALSQVVHRTDGSRWLVESGLYPVLAQDAVLLERAQSSEPARQFLKFLRQATEARSIIMGFGYTLPPEP